MSAAEIADNKWELESTKPPVKDAGSIGQILVISGLALFFTYVVIMSLVGIVSPKQEGGLADKYKDMEAAGAEAAPEAGG